MHPGPLGAVLILRQLMRRVPVIPGGMPQRGETGAQPGRRRVGGERGFEAVDIHGASVADAGGGRQLHGRSRDHTPISQVEKAIEQTIGGIGEPATPTGSLAGNWCSSMFLPDCPPGPLGDVVRKSLITNTIRHPSESWDPCLNQRRLEITRAVVADGCLFCTTLQIAEWVPAFAGMTGFVAAAGWRNMICAGQMCAYARVFARDRNQHAACIPPHAFRSQVNLRHRPCAVER